MKLFSDRMSKCRAEWLMWHGGLLLFGGIVLSVYYFSLYSEGADAAMRKQCLERLVLWGLVAAVGTGVLFSADVHLRRRRQTRWPEAARLSKALMRNLAGWETLLFPAFALLSPDGPRKGAFLLRLSGGAVMLNLLLLLAGPLWREGSIRHRDGCRPGVS